MTRLTDKPCAICGIAFKPKRSRVKTCGSRRCANLLAYRNYPGPRNPRIPKKRCPECTVEFQPGYRSQECCSRACGSARSMRQSPARRQALAARAIRGREVRTAKVRAKVQHMTPEQAFAYGRQLERSAIWQRLIRRRVIDPKFVDRAVGQ